ncbi:MAG TPA: CDP-alcohol phosphatidyltransferase family protein [Acidimicrobiia bacterium]|jgi:cardiolipin synthase
MTVAEVSRDRGVWTVPNAITLVRLLCVPLFLWLLLGADEAVWAGILLAVLGATDWVDGYVARHFDQGSEIGKVLDPVADRVMLIVAAFALIVDGIVPVWVGVLVLAREVIVGGATLALAAAGARRIDVQWVGKAGTLAVMFALPLFVLLDALSPSWIRDLVWVATWSFTVGGLALSYYAAAKYIPLATQALREGRAARTAAGSGGTA